MQPAQSTREKSQNYRDKLKNRLEYIKQVLNQHHAQYAERFDQMFNKWLMQSVQHKRRQKLQKHQRKESNKLHAEISRIKKQMEHKYYEDMLKTFQCASEVSESSKGISFDDTYVNDPQLQVEPITEDDIIKSIETYTNKELQTILQTILQTNLRF